MFLPPFFARALLIDEAVNLLLIKSKKYSNPWHPRKFSFNAAVRQCKLSLISPISPFIRGQFFYRLAVLERFSKFLSQWPAGPVA
jgi:hypothetical protein